ncbi:hypothetical protein AN403_6029 [Pseudomonas fluorescens]|uniref:Uncharacterized protein n=1 Tax=Pseudomonas fluorescens TaxID=294 RepID=A0A0N8NY37_PSEFL|nr:hypothetical protein AN403_6029 [Pseudomonas fluorescens]
MRPSASTGIGMTFKRASSSPFRVRKNPGSSIQTFLPSRPNTRSASPKPELYPEVMNTCSGRQWRFLEMER